MHDRIDHAVFNEKFAALKSFGKFLTNGLLNHTRTRKADQGAWFGDIQIAKHGETSGHAARSWIGQYRNIWQPFLVEMGESRRDLRHLHQAQRTFLHAGATGT